MDLVINIQKRFNLFSSEKLLQLLVLKMITLHHKLNSIKIKK